MSGKSMMRVALPLLALLLGGVARADPLPPLDHFLAGARRASLATCEAALVAVERNDEALVALGRVLPTFSFSGMYKHNQYEVDLTIPPNALPSTWDIPSGVIQAHNQWEGIFEVDVPVIDVAGWVQAHAARQAARAARAGARATMIDVEKQVARSYYQLVGAAALRQSAERSLEAAQATSELARQRQQAGSGTPIDVARADAEVERARQSVANAELLAALARRALRTLSGSEAVGDAPPLIDDLHDEAPLSEWEALANDGVPAIAAAAEARRAANTSALAAGFMLMPTLSFSAYERLTNAGAFAGSNTLYIVMFNLNWRLDLAGVALFKQQRDATELARVREERARATVRDQLHEAWQKVRADIVKDRAARAQANATSLAAQYSAECYRRGGCAQLDVVLAQRDAYAAEVARIQADADLSFGRALLRLEGGQAATHVSRREISGQGALDPSR
jgi:outer membrane protein